mgnify:CR=1 FL=1
MCFCVIMLVACHPNYAPLPYVQLLIQTGQGLKLHAQVHGPNGLMNYVLTQTIVLLFTITAMLHSAYYTSRRYATRTSNSLNKINFTCAMSQGVK